MSRIRNIFNPAGWFRRGAADASAARRGIRPGAVSLLGADTPDTAMALSAVHRCVRLIADSVASLPLRVERRYGTLYLPSSYEPLLPLLNLEPNPVTAAPDMWSGAVQDILLWGNAYIIPEKHNGMVAALRKCTPGAVCYDATTDTYHISDTLQGISGVYGAHEVIHFRGLTTDGKTGRSVLSYAAMTLGIGRAMGTETLNRFSPGGMIRGILGNAEARASFAANSPKEVKTMAEDMQEAFDNGARIFAMPREVSFKELSMTSADLQFLESRKFEVREICRFFGVSPSFVYDDTSANYKSVEMAQTAFLTQTLNPLLRRLEVELTRKLLGEDAQTGERRITFDRAAMNAFDTESRLKHQRGLLELGATVNEIRRMNNLPAIEGGDTPVITANVKPLGEFNQPN